MDEKREIKQIDAVIASEDNSYELTVLLKNEANIPEITDYTFAHDALIRASTVMSGDAYNYWSPQLDHFGRANVDHDVNDIEKKSDVNNITIALARYFRDNDGKYPDCSMRSFEVNDLYDCQEWVEFSNNYLTDEDLNHSVLGRYFTGSEPVYSGGGYNTLGTWLQYNVGETCGGVGTGNASIRLNWGADHKPYCVGL